jgi:hypothetical protein
MPLFISYSHQDEVFVSRLAAELAFKRRHVWLDRLEVRVGDSLITKIQNAITEASGLLIVLSPASVGSAWCQKELNAGLIRELEEKRVLVLPLLIADCAIPLFLKEKKYADFRKSFDEGFRELLGATASISSESLGRSADDTFYHDWAIDWSVTDSELHLHITCASFYHQKPYSVLCNIEIHGEERAAKKLAAYDKAGLGPIGRAVILTTCAEMVDHDKLQLLITDSDVAIQQVAILDTKTSLRYDLKASGRRLGDDSAHDLLYDYGAVLRLARDMLLARSRKPTTDEVAAMLEGKFGA